MNFNISSDRISFEVGDYQYTARCNDCLSSFDSCCAGFMVTPEGIHHFPEDVQPTMWWAHKRVHELKIMEGLNERDRNAFEELSYDFGKFNVIKKFTRDAIEYQDVNFKEHVIYWKTDNVFPEDISEAIMKFRESEKKFFDQFIQQI